MGKIRDILIKVKDWYDTNRCFDRREAEGVAIFGKCSGLAESCESCKYFFGTKYYSPFKKEEEI